MLTKKYRVETACPYYYDETFNTIPECLNWSADKINFYGPGYSVDIYYNRGRKKGILFRSYTLKDKIWGGRLKKFK